MAESEGGGSSELVSGIKEQLSRKVGPLPVFGYVAIGLVAVFIIQKRRRPAVKPTSAAAVGSESSFIPDSYYSPGAVQLPNGYVPSTDETNADETQIWTNQQWIYQASKRLAKSHPEDSTDVIRRLRQFLSGGQLSEGEYMASKAITEDAIQLVGPPPEPYVQATMGPITAIGNPTPPPPPVASPTNNGMVKQFTLADFGGSIENAAEKLYGDPNAWWKFRVVGGDPNTGWITRDSWSSLGPHTVLAANPQGRIRD